MTAEDATGTRSETVDCPYVPEEVEGEFGWLWETSFWRRVHTFSCPLGNGLRVRFFAADDPDDDEEEDADLHRGKPYVACAEPAFEPGTMAHVVARCPNGVSVALSVRDAATAARVPAAVARLMGDLHDPDGEGGA